MCQSSQFQTELKISNSLSNIKNNRKMNVSSFLFYLTITFGIGGAEPVTKRDSFIVKELLKSHPYTNYNECDMLTVSAEPILNIYGESLQIGQFHYILKSFLIFRSPGVGRTYLHFTTLDTFYSTLDRKEFAQKIALMPCFFALITSTNFPQALDFAGYINGLPGNPVKSRKKYVVISTPKIDSNLIQNLTIHFNVNIISRGSTGMKKPVSTEGLKFMIMDLFFRK